MKKKLKKLLAPAKFIAAVILLTSLSSCGESGDVKTGVKESSSNNEIKKNPCDDNTEAFYTTDVMPNEDTLLLTFMETATTTAIPDIERSKTYLSINSKSVAPLVDSIETSAINAMTVIANNLTVPTTCTNYITGLRIEYGISSDKIKLYYRPVKFCRQNESYGQNNEHFGDYKAVEGNLYEYNGTAFVTAGTSAATDISEYAKKMSIEHNLLNTGVKPNPILFAPGDVTSLVFSFQEIYTLIKNNPGVTYLKVWNYLRNVSTNDTPYFKHSLYIAANNAEVQPDQNFAFVAKAGKYANLSHLCPSACSTSDFIFRLVNRGN